jgi:dienelactone hydrolase
MTRRLLVLLAVLAACGTDPAAIVYAGPPRVGASAPPVQASTSNVTLRASDGVPIAGTLYLPSRRPAPAVILVHMQTRSRDDWQGVAVHLADAGIAALAIDLRGHGASGTSADASRGTAEELARGALDVQAARAYLATRPDIADRVGIAGASIGANLAIAVASNDRTIRSLALLSPGLDYRGVRTEAAMKKYNERPALIVASQEDAYAVRSARQLAVTGSGTREVKILADAGHGTVMLSRSPDLAAALVDWFQRTLI